MSFNRQLESQLATERLLTYLAAAFAVVGCVLAAIGLYGVIAYYVSRRTSEIGVRMALGASRTNVVWNVFSEAARLMIFGAAAGIAIALLSGRFIAALLYHTTAADPVLLGATLLLVLTVAGLAALIPAIRAARIDAMEALRWE